MQYINFLSLINKKLVIVSTIIIVHTLGKQQENKTLLQIFIKILTALNVAWIG